MTTMAHCLMLSSTWEPMHITGWQRALGLVQRGRVEVLEHHDDWVVRSASMEVPVPAVIRFLEPTEGWRKRGARFSRENIYARDKGQCQYCGKPVSRDEFTFDHVIPRKRGGTTRWENIVVCCYEDNQRKGDKTLAEAGMRLIRRPTRPKRMGGVIRIALPAGVLPEKWKAYLRSESYWKDELHTD